MAVRGTVSNNNSQDRSDIVAYWSLSLADGVHTIEFEHGTTTGKRVLRVDGKEILRQDWMFKLVGEITFKIGALGTKCELKIDPLPYFAFSYSLTVDGKPLQKFAENQSRVLRTWAVLINGKRYRVILERQTLDVWVNGEREDAEHGFVKTGTEINFKLGDSSASIRASTADKKKGVVHELYVNGKLVDDNDEI